jgi:hypothetical protein
VAPQPQLRTNASCQPSPPWQCDRSTFIPNNDTLDQPQEDREATKQSEILRAFALMGFTAHNFRR